jgi:hypothetical protein
VPPVPVIVPSVPVTAPPVPVTAPSVPVTAPPVPVTAPPVTVTSQTVPVTEPPLPVTAPPAPVTAPPVPVIVSSVPVTAPHWPQVTVTSPTVPVIAPQVPVNTPTIAGENAYCLVQHRYKLPMHVMTYCRLFVRRYNLQCELAILLSKYLKLLPFFENFAVLLCLTCTLWSSLYEVEARFGRHAVESQDRDENHQPGRHPIIQWKFQHKLSNSKDTKAFLSILFKETRESLTCCHCQLENLTGCTIVNI